MNTIINAKQHNKCKDTLVDDGALASAPIAFDYNSDQQ